jgi:thiol-disulfide isomerase/thioredoxin
VAVAVAAVVFLVLRDGGQRAVTGVVRDGGQRAVTGPSFSGDFRQGGLVRELRLPSLGGDGVVDLADFRGRPVVLNFFASWCPFCIAEMPAFERVHRDVGETVAFLGVAQRDTPGAALALVEQTGITYPTALDERGRFFDALGTLGMPTTLFIGPDGRIAYVQVGPLDEAGLRSLIRQHLGVEA